VQIFASNAQVYFENVRKRSKTFENIRKYSKSSAKYSKIFENIRIFCRPLRELCEANNSHSFEFLILSFKFVKCPQGKLAKAAEAEKVEQLNRRAVE